MNCRAISFSGQHIHNLIVENPNSFKTNTDAESRKNFLTYAGINAGEICRIFSDNLNYESQKHKKDLLLFNIDLLYSDHKSGLCAKL